MNNSEEVSLSFSGFYDEGQLFKSKSTNYWILMTHILNLPPTCFLVQKETLEEEEEEEEEETGAVSKKRARLHSSNERNQESSNERNQEASSSVEHPALK